MDNMLNDFFKDKVVLVTGGTGSIGSEIVRKVLKYPIKQLRVFSRDEFKQFNLEKEFSGLPKGKVRFLIGDIRDRERIFLAMENVDIVFNAAAMKHVPLCEDNPFEAVKTNVLGTQNVVDAARTNNVKKFLHISTDKAAMPMNVMGATKLLAERIVILAEHYKGTHDTQFCAVRFGNVFASRGSVVPLFADQIKNGGPVTLTHSEMTRFIMQIPQAVDLVFKAINYAHGGDLFILKMPVMRIEDLAKAMIEVLAPRFNRKPGEIKIKETGKRDGEKIYELLLTEEEADNLYENDEMLCIAKQLPSGFTRSKLKSYRSDEATMMKSSEVVDLVRNVFK